MDSYYGYDTALWYWRLTAPRNVQPRRVSRVQEPDGYVRTEPQELQNRPNWLDPAAIQYAGGVIHPLVFHKVRRPSTSALDWRTWEPSPRDAFVAAGEHSFVASPEWCFLQMAQRLDFAELVLLGMELCGLYCLDPESEQGVGQRSAPLTNCKRIAAFLAENEGARGRRAAQTALKYVVDRAASPMESAVVMLLFLPFMRGGYGLPRPNLNWQINLDQNGRHLLGGARCYGDICWPDFKLDVEYLGELPHGGAADMRADRRRTLAIEQSGFEVIEITKDQVTDLQAFDIVAQRVARKVGKRIPKSMRGITAERRALADVLFAWNPHADAPADGTAQQEEEARVFGRRA